MLTTGVIATQTPSVLRMQSLHVLKLMFEAEVQRPTVLSVRLSHVRSREVVGVCTPQRFRLAVVTLSATSFLDAGFQEL